MNTEQFKDGSVSYSQSPKLIDMAERWLVEYLIEFGEKKPGELEDELVAEPSSYDLVTNPQANWRKSPFYPALGRLFSKGVVSYKINDEDDVIYFINDEYKK